MVTGEIQAVPLDYLQHISQLSMQLLGITMSKQSVIHVCNTNWKHYNKYCLSTSQTYLAGPDLVAAMAIIDKTYCRPIEYPSSSRSSPRILFSL